MPKHVDMVKEEVEKLKEASAITEVLYPRWLSNTVVVKKKTGGGCTLISQASTELVRKTIFFC